MTDKHEKYHSSEDYCNGWNQGYAEGIHYAGEMMKPFIDAFLRSRVVIGDGSVNELSEEARKSMGIK